MSHVAHITSYVPHSTKFINHLFVKLIILYKPHLNVSHIQKLYQNDII
jgi:hypothetical protein